MYIKKGVFDVCAWFLLPFSSLFLHWRTWSTHPSPLQNLKWASYWDGPILRVMMGLWHAVGPEQSRYDCWWQVPLECSILFTESESCTVSRLFLKNMFFLFCFEDDEVTPYAEMPWTYYQVDGNAIYFRRDLLPDMLLKKGPTLVNHQRSQSGNQRKEKGNNMMDFPPCRYTCSLVRWCQVWAIHGLYELYINIKAIHLLSCQAAEFDSSEYDLL